MTAPATILIHCESWHKGKAPLEGGGIGSLVDPSPSAATVPAGLSALGAPASRGGGAATGRRGARPGAWAGERAPRGGREVSRPVSDSAGAGAKCATGGMPRGVVRGTPERGGGDMVLVAGGRGGGDLGGERGFGGGKRGGREG